MRKTNLYKYTQNNVIIITPNKRNEADIPSQMRLIADENFILTNGVIKTTAVDAMLDEVDLWSEVYEMEESVNLKAQAYDILMGVTE